MASYKKKTGQTGDNAPDDWKKVVIEETTKVTIDEVVSLTYEQLEAELEQQKIWQKEVNDKVASLEAKMKKVKGIADK